MAQPIIRSTSFSLKGSLDTDGEAAESQLGRVVKPLNDAEVFQNLPEVYKAKDFSVSNYLKETLPSDFDTPYLEQELNHKTTALSSVNVLLTKKVLSNFDAYTAGMKQIRELGSDLQTTVQLTKGARQHLATSQLKLTQSPLRLLANYQRRERLGQVVKLLEQMKELVSAEKRIALLLDDGDYTEAHRLCIRCAALLEILKPFHAVKSYHTLLQNRSQQLLDKLDQALLQACKNRERLEGDEQLLFDAEEYEKLIRTYHQLGKIDRAVEKLQKMYRDGSVLQIRSALAQHVALSAPPSTPSKPLSSTASTTMETSSSISTAGNGNNNSSDTPISLSSSNPLMSPRGVTNDKSRVTIRSLAAEVRSPAMIAIAIPAVLEHLFDHLSVPFAIARWHSEKQPSTSSGDYLSAMRMGIERLRKQLWEDVQKHLSVVLTVSAGYTQMKIDEFLSLLDHLSRFLEVGEEFSTAFTSATVPPTTPLMQSIQTISRKYFYTFHSSRLEDLRTMIEHEQIKELVDFNRSIAAQQPSKEKARTSFFESVFSKTMNNPFSAQSIERRKTEEANSELKKESESPQKKPQRSNVSSRNSADGASSLSSPSSSPSKSSSSASSSVDLFLSEGPVLTAASNAVAKQVGKYLHLMRLLHPITAEVFVGIVQVFEYYIFSIYCFFAASDKIPMTSKLKTSLQAMRERLLRTQSANTAASSSSSASPSPSASSSSAATVTGSSITGIQGSASGGMSSSPMPQPGMTAPTSAVESPIALEDARVQITLPSRPISLAQLQTAPYEFLERSAIAIESLMFLSEVLMEVKQSLVVAMPKSALAFLTEFYASSVAIIPEFRFYAYKVSLNQLIHFEVYMNQIANVKWDDKEMPMEHNVYVNDLIKEFRVFSARMADIATLSQKQKKVVWEVALYLLMEYLVEGYSRVKKCSNEGRALMSLDWLTLHTSLSKLSPVKINPQFVENYIKAFYEPDIAAWASQHTEYSQRQLQSIIQLKKKALFPF